MSKVRVQIDCDWTNGCYREPTGFKCVLLDPDRYFVKRILGFDFDWYYDEESNMFLESDEETSLLEFLRRFQEEKCPYLSWRKQSR